MQGDPSHRRVDLGDSAASSRTFIFSPLQRGLSMRRGWDFLKPFVPRTSMSTSCRLHAAEMQGFRPGLNGVPSKEAR